MPGRPDLRPRTVAELLDGSFFLYRRHFGRLLMTVTLLSVPTLVIAALTARFATDALRTVFESLVESSTRNPQKYDFGAQLRDQFTMQSQMLPVSVLMSVLQSVSRGGSVAVMAVAAAFAVNRETLPSAVAILRRAAPRVPGAILAHLLQAVVGLSPLGCCLPLLIVAIVVVTPVPAILMFEQGALETRLRRSVGASLPGRVGLAVMLPFAQVADATLRALSLGWHALTLVRGTWLVFVVGTFLSFFVLAAATGVGLLADSWELGFWANHYCEVLFLPVYGVAVVLWYLDLRVRREGADLTVARLELA